MIGISIIRTYRLLHVPVRSSQIRAPNCFFYLRGFRVIISLLFVSALQVRQGWLNEGILFPVQFSSYNHSPLSEKFVILQKMPGELSTMKFNKLMILYRLTDSVNLVTY